MARADRRRDLARVGEIAQVAARHGFGYAFGRKDAPESGGERAGRSRGERIRAMLDELGPTFVKFGQLLSMRPDMVPADIVAELRGLQDQAHPEAFSRIQEVIEEDLGLHPDRVFAELDPVPMAAASIGQVHAARLPGGDEVVVKVQRPDAERQINADIALLYQVAAVAKDRVERLQFIDLVEVVDEFKRTVRRELDYEIEARNAELFRQNFARDDRVEVPSVYWRYTTSRVLVMSRVSGEPLAHVRLDEMPVEDRRSLARRITETWMEMLFVHGFFHADPHPANILVRGPDALGLVDFGMTGSLSSRDREAAVRLLADVVTHDVERIARHLRALGVRFPREMEDELADHLGVVLQRYSSSSLGELDARQVLRDLFQAIYRLDLTLPTRWVLLDKTLATLAGVAAEIDPELNVFEVAQPYARRIAAQRFSPERLVERVGDNLGRYSEAILDYPFQVSDLLDAFKDGEVEVRIRQIDLRDSIDRTQGAANRLTLALVATALLLGSAIFAAGVDPGPDLVGIPLLVVPTFLAGVVVALWLAVGILRSGRW